MWVSRLGPVQDVGQVVWALPKHEGQVSLAGHFLLPHTALKPEADAESTKDLCPTVQGRCRPDVKVEYFVFFKICYPQKRSGFRAELKIN